MALRIHGDTRNFAKIEVGWEVQEIGHRVVLNFGRRGRLCRERTGRMRNYQQQEIRRELHFHSSLGTRVKSPDTQPDGPSQLEEANVEVLNTQRLAPAFDSQDLKPIFIRFFSGNRVAPGSRNTTRSMRACWSY